MEKLDVPGSALAPKELEAVTPSTTPYEEGKGEFQSEIAAVTSTKDVKLGAMKPGMGSSMMQRRAKM